jgi:MraZ protein
VEDGQTNGGNEARFWGTHEHSLDAKGRVILPARFREPFRGGAFLTKLFDGCLGLWTPVAFERRTADMLEIARRGQSERNVTRSFAAGSFEVTPDGQGRIAIPPMLRDYARLESDVVVNGAINHVEIWHPDKWREVDAEGSQQLLSGQDALADMGF